MNAPQIIHPVLVRTGYIDPKDYPFRHHIEANKHLDNDEDRHKIQCVAEHIGTAYAGREHTVCDKEQLDATGKYRTPKKLQEAKARGFNNPLEMVEADKKAEADDLKKQVADLTALVQQLLKK